MVFAALCVTLALASLGKALVINKSPNSRASQTGPTLDGLGSLALTASGDMRNSTLFLETLINLTTPRLINHTSCGFTEGQIVPIWKNGLVAKFSDVSPPSDTQPLVQAYSVVAENLLRYLRHPYVPSSDPKETLPRTDVSWSYPTSRPSIADLDIVVRDPGSVMRIDAMWLALRLVGIAKPAEHPCAQAYRAEFSYGEGGFILGFVKVVLHQDRAVQ